jgi:hypothetical protein
VTNAFLRVCTNCCERRTKNRKLTIVMAARHGARNVDPGFGNPMPSHRLESSRGSPGPRRE